MDKEYNYYAKKYWIAWFMIITVFTTGNIFNIFLLRDIPFDILFFGLFLLIGIIGIINQARLLNYLKKNHYEKWEYLTTTPLLGSGNSNGFRMLEFFLSRDTLNDPIVTKLTSEVKYIILLQIVHFFSIPIFFLGLNILYSETGFNAKLNSIIM